MSGEKRLNVKYRTKWEAEREAKKLNKLGYVTQLVKTYDNTGKFNRWQIVCNKGGG